VVVLLSEDVRKQAAKQPGPCNAYVHM
jgi:hypothetical protein